MTKSMAEKLGWRPGVASLIWRAPEPLPSSFALLSGSAASPVLIVAFLRDQRSVGEAANEVLPLYQRGTHLWLCYPKRSGRIPTDLSRDVGWMPIHAIGLLPVAQLAIDEDWSALRFRYRDEIGKLTRKSPTGAKTPTRD